MKDLQVMYWPFTDEPTLEKRISFLNKRIYETYDDGPPRYPALTHSDFPRAVIELLEAHGWERRA